MVDALQEYIPQVIHPRDPVRQSLLEEFRKQTATYKKNEIEEGNIWSVEPETGLMEGKDSFQGDMACVLDPEEGTIQSYLENVVIGDRAGEAIGIEYGGQGRVFSDFRIGIFKRTAAATLTDRRLPEEKQHDKSIHHEVIPGDFTDLSNPEESEAKLQDWLKGEKADVILERMEGPLYTLPKDPYFLNTIVQQWYKNLRDGGVLIAQVPQQLVPLLKPWKEKLQKLYPDTVKVRYAHREPAYFYRKNRWFVRLNKQQGSPEYLPELTPLEIKHAYDDVDFLRSVFDFSLQHWNAYLSNRDDLLGKLKPLQTTKPSPEQVFHHFDRAREVSNKRDTAFYEGLRVLMQNYERRVQQLPAVDYNHLPVGGWSLLRGIGELILSDETVSFLRTQNNGRKVNEKIILATGTDPEELENPQIMHHALRVTKAERTEDPMNAVEIRSLDISQNVLYILKFSKDPQTPILLMKRQFAKDSPHMQAVKQAFHEGRIFDESIAHTEIASESDLSRLYTNLDYAKPQADLSAITASHVQLQQFAS